MTAPFICATDKGGICPPRDKNAKGIKALLPSVKALFWAICLGNIPQVSTATPGSGPRSLVRQKTSLPFCAAMRTQKADIRAGPGVEHRQLCTLEHAAGWPIIVVRQSANNWVLVYDITGLRGWIKRTRITRKPYVVTVAKVDGFSRPDGQSPVVAHLMPGVRAQRLGQEGSWISIYLAPQKLRAWIPQEACWPNTPTDSPLGPAQWMIPARLAPQPPHSGPVKEAQT